ncbi:MAG: hypothetical protein PVJ67_05425 [Candidatus Pacearchaeota archaeon]|jgi:hypothetical protein
MLDRKELANILIISLVFAFAISLIESLEIFLYTLLFIFLIIIINVIAKKITAFYFDSDIKINLWQLKRFGLFGVLWGIRRGSHPSKKFKNPFPIGLILPIITTAFSLGYITWLGSLTFKIRSKIYRAAKKHRFYKFKEIPEFHIGLIAASGILANLLFTIIGYLIGFPDFAKLNLYYAFWNLIPISTLDGNKILFANKFLWSILILAVLIGITLTSII